MKRRFIAAFSTVILGFAVIACIGTYVAAAKNDTGTVIAENAGTYTAPDGKTYLS